MIGVAVGRVGRVGSAGPKPGVGIFDLLVNGQRLLVNTQPLKATGDGN